MLELEESKYFPVVNPHSPLFVDSNDNLERKKKKKTCPSSILANDPARNVRLPDLVCHANLVLFYTVH